MVGSKVVVKTNDLDKNLRLIFFVRSYRQTFFLSVIYYNGILLKIAWVTWVYVYLSNLQGKNQRSSI